MVRKVKTMVMVKEKVDCPKCGKKVSKGNLPKHQKTKKCKNHNDKTAAKVTIPPKSPSEAGIGRPASAAEYPSQQGLKVINLKGEYDKNMETLNPKSKSKGKEKKYQCGACGATFDNLNEGKCPDCGEQLA